MTDFIIPPWLKIVGPIVVGALLIMAVVMWGNGKYRDGKRDGTYETDQKWLAASEQLKKDAAASATKADDRAVKRLEEHVAQAQEDQEALDEANRNGTSPLDALFN